VRKINKERNEIGEKSEEWEMKGQLLGLPITLALPIYSCNFTPKDLLAKEEEAWKYRRALYQRFPR
jgi:hypothetical protein